MRTFALGVLRYTPDQFGKMRIGHMLEAMAGYEEAQSTSLRAQTEILRVAVSILWNVQVLKEDRLMPKELWRLPWDKIEEGGVLVTDEEMVRVLKEQKEFLEKHFQVN